jgi:AcrR family transcriptional regulator
MPGPALDQHRLSRPVAPAADLGTLPRGPHKLSREEVIRSQRSRIMRAMAEAMAERGYVSTSVADVLRRARVSRETFYQQFSSKQDCFIAVYEQSAGMMLANLEQEAAAPATSLERFDRTIGAYLDGLAAEPAFARLFMVEVYSAGAEALERRAEIQQRFTQLMIQAAGTRRARERFACEMLVAAITMLVTVRLAVNDFDGVKALRAPLISLVREALARIEVDQDEGTCSDPS